MMRVFVLGTGRMGAWFAQELSAENNVAVLDRDPEKLAGLEQLQVLSTLEELPGFAPELVLNCVGLHQTIPAFAQILPFLGKDTILADITSVKRGMQDFYVRSGFRFASVHPMFGPTFANYCDLKRENAVIISESDPTAAQFFARFFQTLQLHIFRYSFQEHDRIMAYSLATPFVSTLVFGGCMKSEALPGTTFRKHMEIARGLMREDDHLLAEILFNPHTLGQIQKVSEQLSELAGIIQQRDFGRMQRYLDHVRENIHE